MSDNSDPYRCLVCSKSEPGPMLRMESQAEVLAHYKIPHVKRYTFVCLPCSEKALGRPVVRADLVPLPINGHFGRWIDP